ncbi:MAG: hypothetical protein KC620_18230, partial [Myxococcales bacterium]|nr:hypothetical protein [Myxococcales bacterium]
MWEESRARWTIVGVWALLLGGCVTLPTPPAQRALYLDLRSIVQTRARIDWVIDRVEIEAVAPALMASVCQATPADRLALAGWLDRRLVAEGGPARAQWLAAGKDLGPAREALLIERISAALHYVDDHQGECPFWLEPDPRFAGVQANTDRIVILAESMGSGQLVLEGGELLFGGAGLARLIPAYGVSDRLTLGLGFEAGVASTFPRAEGGGRSVKPVAAAGVPFLVRVLDGTLRYDLDLAAVTR